MSDFPTRPADWAQEPRGARTGAVLATLDASPSKRTHFRVIRKVTGLDTRTLIAILYSLQAQGKVSPVEPSPTKDETVYARVDNTTVFPEPIVRQCPFKARRKRRAGIEPDRVLTQGQDVEVVAPHWLVPRMPLRSLHLIGEPRATHYLVTADDLGGDDLDDDLSH